MKRHMILGIIYKNLFEDYVVFIMEVRWWVDEKCIET